MFAWWIRVLETFCVVKKVTTRDLRVFARDVLGVTLTHDDPTDMLRAFMEEVSRLKTESEQDKIRLRVLENRLRFAIKALHGELDA